MRIRWWTVTLFCFVCGTASAKLPPPTPEEQQAAAARKAKEEAQLEEEKKRLEQAQDRVADYYKRASGSGGGGASQRSGRVGDHAMPKTAKELPRSAGPQGGNSQSAEAHSAPAK